jgi:hypothetical protein
MSDTPKEASSPEEVEPPSDTEAPATPPTGPEPSGEDDAAPLARPIQEHLAQQLRTTYTRWRRSPRSWAIP